MNELKAKHCIDCGKMISQNMAKRTQNRCKVCFDVAAKTIREVQGNEEDPVRIVINDVTLPSWNKYVNNNQHWAQKNRVAHDWQEYVFYTIKDHMIPENPFEVPVAIEITCHFPNKAKMLDPDNICAKLAIDGLKGRIIKDDTPEYIDEVTLRSRLDRKRPRTEIVVTPKKVYTEDSGD